MFLRLRQHRGNVGHLLFEVGKHLHAKNQRGAHDGAQLQHSHAQVANANAKSLQSLLGSVQTPDQAIVVGVQFDVRRSRSNSLGQCHDWVASGCR